MGGWPCWTLSLLSRHVGTPELLNSFPAPLLASSNVAICSLPGCQSKIQQSNQWQSRLASFFFEKWQISLDNALLGIVFPPAPKCYAVQPIRLQHSPAAYATSPRLCWITRQNSNSAHNRAGQQYSLSCHEGWELRLLKRCVFVFMCVRLCVRLYVFCTTWMYQFPSAGNLHDWCLSCDIPVIQLTHFRPP